MTDRYRFKYADYTVYRHVTDLLLSRVALDREVIVDLGCGYGAIAEPLRQNGLTYIGFDGDMEAVGDLRERGFEAELVNLSDPDETRSIVKKTTGERGIGGMVMIDTLEHLTNGPELLESLRDFALEEHESIPTFIIAVPNITHLDIAGKLLMGRWDMTQTGLLDDTHVSFFSEGRLRSMTSQAGWEEVASNDFELPISDQHFPAGAAAINLGSPLQMLLQAVREQSASSALVNEFVRVYSPRAKVRDVRVQAELPPLFLSILMRTQGTRRETLQDVLLALAAQTIDDFELLLLVHRAPRQVLGELQYLVDAHGPEFAQRVRLVPVDSGGRSRPLNVALRMARGEYLAVLDDDDIVFSHWVETFKEMAAKAPARVLRTVPSAQTVRRAKWDEHRVGYEIVGRPSCPWPLTFDVVEHLFENLSPPCSYALPRSAFDDMGIRFDETLPVLEDWDVLMRTVVWSGVLSEESVTSLYRWWEDGGDSSVAVHTELEWARARSAVVAKLDAAPLLLPMRAISGLHTLHEQAAVEKGALQTLRLQFQQLQDENDRLCSIAADHRRDAEELRRSMSWKVSAPVRILGSIARRRSAIRRRMDAQGGGSE